MVQISVALSVAFLHIGLLLISTGIVCVYETSAECVMETCTADKKEVKKCTCMDPLPMAEVDHCWNGPQSQSVCIKRKIQSQFHNWKLLHELKRRVFLKEDIGLCAQISFFVSERLPCQPLWISCPKQKVRSDCQLPVSSCSQVSAVGASTFFPKSIFHGKHPWMLSFANGRRRHPKFPELLYCVCANLDKLNASLEILQSLPGDSWENGRFREALHVSAFLVYSKTRRCRGDAANSVSWTYSKSSLGKPLSYLCLLMFFHA